MVCCVMKQTSSALSYSRHSLLRHTANIVCCVIRPTSRYLRFDIRNSISRAPRIQCVSDISISEIRYSIFDSAPSKQNGEIPNAKQKCFNKKTGYRQYIAPPPMRAKHECQKRLFQKGGGLPAVHRLPADKKTA